MAASVTTAPTSTNRSSWWTSKVTGTSFVALRRGLAAILSVGERPSDHPPTAGTGPLRDGLTRAGPLGRRPAEGRGVIHVRRHRRRPQARGPAARAGWRHPGPGRTPRSRRPRRSRGTGRRPSRCATASRSAPTTSAPPRPSTRPPPSRSRRTSSEVDSLKDAIDDPQPQGDHPRRGRPHPCLPAPRRSAEPDDADAALLAFDPPPAGHKDWLTVDLPGL